MSTTKSTAGPAGPSNPTLLAKAALRRLVASKLEPTPENYARAYRAEAGQPEPPAHADRAHAPADRTGDGDSQAASLAHLIERIVKGVERGGRQWTSGRRKESLQRVLDGTRSDSQLLQQRLSQLIGSWDRDSLDSAAARQVKTDATADPATVHGESLANEDGPTSIQDADAADLQEAQSSVWLSVVANLMRSLQQALSASEASGLPKALADLQAQIDRVGTTPELADEVAQLCERADRVLQHRNHLFDQLGVLCRELTEGLAELAEDESWVKGQLDAMRSTLDDGLSARGVRGVSELLRHTREHQRGLREERSRAREALKSLMSQMLQELGELGSRTGRFHENVGRYAEEIDHADSLESLAGVVSEMLQETRSVQEIVGQTRQRLQAEHDRAAELSERVVQLESELRRLSEEVTTDQLTQIANRRGLLQAFEVDRAQAEREGKPLAIGLLDIDNFKRLNDELGHAAGDVALRSLAEVVAKSLRPGDVVARFGGEEFVVLLPDTTVDDGQQILTRLQRSLSVGLFMHERKTVFVTFSAGVTIYRPGESIEEAMERADEALYEAKRTGKNRTCTA